MSKCSPESSFSPCRPVDLFPEECGISMTEDRQQQQPVRERSLVHQPQAREEDRDRRKALLERELEAMRVITQVLEPLDDAAKDRVLRWAAEVFLPARRHPLDR